MNQSISDIGINLALLIAVFSAVLLVSLYSLYRLSRKYRLLFKHVNYLQNEIRAINSGNLCMGRKISRFAEEIANGDSGKFSSSVINEKSYQQAGLLLSRGATIEEVVESCDIAPAEAELLAIMSHSSLKKTIAA